MAVTNVSAARRAGFKLTNRGIEKGAGIEGSKLGTRTLFFSQPVGGGELTGAGVVLTDDGIGHNVTFPDANQGIFRFSTRLPTEYVVGADIIVSIYWKTAATSGTIHLDIDIAAKAGSENTASSNQQVAEPSAVTTANKLIKTQVTFAGALFAQSDWIGLQVVREPTDGDDDLGADIQLVGVTMEFTGQG